MQLTQDSSLGVLELSAQPTCSSSLRVVPVRGARVCKLSPCVVEIDAMRARANDAQGGQPRETKRQKRKEKNVIALYIFDFYIRFVRNAVSWA